MDLRKIAIGAAAMLCSCIPADHTTEDVFQKFDAMVPVLEKITLEQSVAEAVEYLHTEVTNDPRLEDECHGLSHIIGESAFKRFGMEEAMQYESDICGSGYIHGVIESYLVGVEDIAEEMQTVCPPNSGKCYHGIGHGLMDRSSNDLPGSIELCDTLDQRSEKIQCSEGVFMENVEADPKTHPTDYLREDDAFFPCRGQESIYEGVCAFYAPRYYVRVHGRDYQAVLDWCETVPLGPRDACVKGVGDVAMKQNIKDPLKVQAICDGAALERRRYCIEGLVSYYIVHFAASSKGRELCIVLNPEYKETCEKVVKQSEVYFPN